MKTVLYILMSIIFSMFIVKSLSQGNMTIQGRGAVTVNGNTIINPCPPTPPTEGTHVATHIQIVWNWSTVSGATGYKWNTSNDFASSIDLGPSTTRTETGLSCNIEYTRYVWAYSGCGTSPVLVIHKATTFLPVSVPVEGIHIPSQTQIMWKWIVSSGASGYKWNTTNDFSNAIDMGTETSKLESGLICNNSYMRYVWAYNFCGYSSPLIINQSTATCPFVCGSSMTINHVAGAVAPVNKAVNYGTVTNIPGEPSKCWITSNLGADHQASSVSDATEASAGWYWQFNRKQGFKHDGITRTPNTTWITPISENSDWLSSNDPCTIELGSGWRIPTYSEWNNVDVSGNWTDWNGPWNSGLKLHASGNLGISVGALFTRGTSGNFHSSTQSSSSTSWYLDTGSYYSNMWGNDGKAYAWSIRCIKD